MKLFDEENNRLVYLEKKSSPDFWENKWNEDKDSFMNSVKSGVRRNLFIKKYLKKYSRKGATILEGGCGNGNVVYGLKNWGYNPTGVDYAKNTVKTIKKYFPKLDIVLGDVRKLEFEDNSFDCYVSLGVIEHFFYGYDEILIEMSRVVKKDGIIVLTYPVMSNIRMKNSRKGIYEKFNLKNSNLDEFYQFALNEKTVIKDFEKKGFKLLEKKGLSGFKGLKDEISNKGIKKILQKIYSINFMPLNLLKRIISLLLSKKSPHLSLLVFKNIKE